MNKKNYLYLNPDQAKPPRPTAIVRQATAPRGFVINAAADIKSVWLKNAPQLNVFRT